MSAAPKRDRDLAQLLRNQHNVISRGQAISRGMTAVADAWWPDAGVAAEVDSREWHLSAQTWEQTMRRHARMTAQGILVLHFTPQRTRTEPAQVVAALRAALSAGRPAGQPQARALPGTG